MNYEWFIALRYLRARRRQIFISIITLISIIGIMTGVMALIIVLSVMTGAIEDVKGKILGANAHLTVYSYQGTISNYREVIKQIESLPEVVSATPYLESQVMLMFGEQVRGAVIRGVEPESALKTTSIGARMLAGKLEYLKPGVFQDEEGLPGIALGKDLSQTLGAGFGDVITVVSPMGSLSPMGLAPSARRFRVVAIFEFGFYEVDSGFVFIDLAQAQKFFHLGDQVDGIEVKLKDLELAEKVGDKIVNLLGYPFWVRTWIQAHKPLFSALKMEQLAFGIILALIVLVAGLNIISTLVMMVMEKYRDIAILKSMGATDGGVMRIFIYQGLVIGVIGTILGAIAGVVLCWIQIRYQVIHLDPTVYQFASLPMKLSWKNVALVCLFALLTSFVSTLYPARQASKMNPAESLRYE